MIKMIKKIKTLKTIKTIKMIKTIKSIKSIKTIKKIKSIKSINVRYMTVQRLSIELAKQVDPVVSRIDTITYGNIHQPIFPPQGNRRLTP